MYTVYIIHMYTVLYTLYSLLYVLFSKLRLNCKIYNCIQCTIEFTIQYTLCFLLRAMTTYIMYSSYTLCSVQRTQPPHIIYVMLCNWACESCESYKSVYIVHFIQYTVHCTQPTKQCSVTVEAMSYCTLHTAHNIITVHIRTILYSMFGNWAGESYVSLYIAYSALHTMYTIYSTLGNVR